MARTASGKLVTIQITEREKRMATRPNVYKNKKKYTRKVKHGKKDYSSRDSE